MATHRYNDLNAHVYVFLFQSIASLLQKKLLKPIATHRYNVLNACFLCSLLQTFYKRRDFNRQQRFAIISFVCVCFFCSRLQAFYKRRSLNRQQRIAIMFSFVFPLQSIANILQKKSLQPIADDWCVCVFLFQSIASLLQKKLLKPIATSRRQLTPKFGRIFGPRAWATLSSFGCSSFSG